MSDYDAMRNMEARMQAQEARLLALSGDVVHLKAAMIQNTTALSEFIELGKGLKVGLKFLGYIEAAAVFTVKVCAAFGLVWAAWKYVIIEIVREVIKGQK